jgi:uncharacterized protein
MDCTWEDLFSQACSQCGGKCCCEACPPLTAERIAILVRNGVRPQDIDNGTYKRLKIKNDGYCVMFEEKRCSIHSVKPETCVAGPFTFDMKGDVLEIYLKKESICPFVTYLKQDTATYRHLYDLAVSHITRLVRTLPPKELAEVLKVEEPETEKVADIPLCELMTDDRRN